MAGTRFGAVHLSLAVGEIWNDSRSAKCYIFQNKMRVVSAKSNLKCRAGCGLTDSRLDHARIGPTLQMTFQPFSEASSHMLGSFFVAGTISGEFGG